MKTGYLFIITFLIIIPVKLFSQAESKAKPAIERTGKITAEWVDRAELTGQSRKPVVKNMLWYRESAKLGEEALPLGNGQLGALVFGGGADERIQLNESTLWDGYPMDTNNPESLKALPDVRCLLFENKNKEAASVASKTMMDHHSGIKPYQSLGELCFDNASDYIRNLDLFTAIATTKYVSEGIQYLHKG